MRPQYASNWQWRRFTPRTVNFTGALAPVDNYGKNINLDTEAQKKKFI
jgi:hypothetical protein